MLWVVIVYVGVDGNRNYIIAIDFLLCLSYNHSRTTLREDGIMNILISPVSQIPIYEQIEAQIREQILSGTLVSGTMLPSIRFLAKELKVGIITIKRAYEDLCKEGMLVSVAGKGIYVAELNTETVRNIYLDQLREQLGEVCRFAINTGISQEELSTLLETIYKEGVNNE